MEIDLSMELLKKYHSLVNHQIEVNMKNGNIVSGVLAGFTRSEESDHTSKVTHLHLIPKNDHSITGEDAFGLPKGMMICQKEISQIQFSDHTIMKFN